MSTVPAPSTGPGPSALAPPAAPPWNAGINTAPPLPFAEPIATKRYTKLKPAGVAIVGLTALIVLVWLVTSSRPIISLALACIGALGVDAWSARRSVRSPSITLTPTGDAVSDEPTRWLLEVEDLARPVSLCPVRTPRPVPVLVEPGRVGVISVPPTARGVVHFLVVDAVGTGPIGLVHAGRRHRITPPAPVVVRPRPVPIHIRWPTPKAVGFGLSEVAPRGDDLFRGVRPYQRGDERRKIHWKSTAHHGELMVREDDGTGVVALQVVVELGPPGPVNERTIGNAAWITEAAIERGWLVQLVTNDDTPPVPQLPVLGSPFGAPPVTHPAPGRPPRPLAQDVTSVDAVRRQLATAAPGRPAAPRWTGLTCLVNHQGVLWP